MRPRDDEVRAATAAYLKGRRDRVDRFLRVGSLSAPSPGDVLSTARSAVSKTAATTKHACRRRHHNERAAFVNNAD